ncbi:MAG: hypothetical protein ACRCT7_13395 [Shewanella sp.]
MKLFALVLLVALGVYLYIRAQRLAREEEVEEARTAKLAADNENTINTSAASASVNVTASSVGASDVNASGVGVSEVSANEVSAREVSMSIANIESHLETSNEAKLQDSQAQEQGEKLAGQVQLTDPSLQALVSEVMGATLNDAYPRLCGLIKRCYKARKQAQVLSQSLALSRWHNELLVLTDTPSGHAFKHLATLLADAGHIDAAIEVCDRALALGLNDGTATGFSGRKQRLQQARP